MILGETMQRPNKKEIQREISDIDQALDFAKNVSLPFEIGKTLIKSLNLTRYNKILEIEKASDCSNSFKRYSSEELRIIEDYLKDRDAKTWQEEQDIISYLSERLQRKKSGIKSKIKSMGLGDKIDSLSEWRKGK